MLYYVPTVTWRTLVAEDEQPYRPNGKINLRNSPLTDETKNIYLHGLSSLAMGPVWLFISFY